MKKMYFYSFFFCCLLLFSCNDNIAHTEYVSEIQNASSMNRFERFIAAFPTVKLPYILDSQKDYTAMNPEFLEHILLVPQNAEIGLTKMVECIATFKVGTHLAVLYKWSERPITKDNPSFFELAVYSPHGALRKTVVLGLQQQENDAFQEDFGLQIGADFLIKTEHYITHFLNDADKYDSFYSNQYKIDDKGEIITIKKAALWEKIPTQFTPSFVESYKKNPNSTPSVNYTKDGEKVILENSNLGHSQAIIKPFLHQGKEYYLVSSLEIEAYSSTQTTAYPYFVNSRIVLLKFNDNQFEIITNKIIDNDKWQSIYEIIQPSCACEPAPNINNKGVVSLTLLEAAVSNAVFADLNEDNQLVLKCRKEDQSEDIIYTF